MDDELRGILRAVFQQAYLDGNNDKARMLPDTSPLIDQAHKAITEWARKKAVGCVPERRILEKKSVYLQYDKGYNHAVFEMLKRIEEG